MRRPVQVERSAVRMWLVALLGIPFVVLGADLFLEQRLLGALGDLIYGTEELPAFEPRDQILAALFLIGGATLTLWGLKELVAPKKILTGDEEGVRLAVAGPFRPAVALPWDSIEDMRYEARTKDGQIVPTVVFDMAEESSLPERPWGARWVGGRQLSMDGDSWSLHPEEVVHSLWRLREMLGKGSEPMRREG